MFTDKAKIFIKSGSGGNGAIAFHREKYVAAGGPDGGDGGKGGSVVFKVDTGLSTLMDFKYKKKYAAQNGENGAGGKQHGKRGEDIIIKVPQGTVIKDYESGMIIADLSAPDSEKVVAKGGNGGWGNAHFATATRQTPNFAKNGQKGIERYVVLELKLLADVGLVGFPNVGKSTMLSKTTKAEPKIANYHFTTLEPNLGVVELDNGCSFVLADIPGIIEGASEGVGLGLEFLRHIERTRLLLHVVDISGIEGRNPLEDFEIINTELKSYNLDLENRPQIVVGNKADIIQDEEMASEFRAEIEKRGYMYFEISAATGKGIGELLKKTYTELSKLPPVTEFESEIDLNEFAIPDTTGVGFEIRNENGVYVVSGSWIEAVGGSVNFSDEESFRYFQRAMKSRGVFDALIEKGVKEGDIVRLGDLEFEFVL